MVCQGLTQSVLQSPSRSHYSLSSSTSLLLTLHGFTLSFSLQPTWELYQTLLAQPMSRTWNVTSQTLPIPSLFHHGSSSPSPLTNLTWIPPLSISVLNLLSQPPNLWLLANIWTPISWHWCENTPLLIHWCISKAAENFCLPSPCGSPEITAMYAIVSSFI